MSPMCLSPYYTAEARRSIAQGNGPQPAAVYHPVPASCSIDPVRTSQILMQKSTGFDSLAVRKVLAYNGSGPEHDCNANALHEMSETKFCLHPNI
jgi:hypothetical protein